MKELLALLLLGLPLPAHAALKAVVTPSASGVLAVPQLVGSSGTPTVAVGAGAGSGATASISSGTNIAGVVNVTTGTATTANATLATITFNGTLTQAPQGCQVWARNTAAAGQVAMVFTTAPSATSWTISSGSAALTASTAYSWSYQCF